MDITARLIDSGRLTPNNPLSELSESYLRSITPLVAGQYDAPVTGDTLAGRNVLFVDGHVEYVRNNEWAARIAPFEM
ncbi:MAG: hypothetical protein HUU46_03595 [Candidatus Hydrogenedentes bacterium]|nr:hypothetical protein [Candidatus Hydrogenedentota bacterium]